MKYITAEGPSSELHKIGLSEVYIKRFPGHTYEAAHEPARFVPFDPEITARAMRNAFEKRKADENEHLDMVVNEWKTRVTELQEQLKTTRETLKELETSVRFVYDKFKKDLAQGYTSKNAIFGVDVLGMALAQIDAGQKGGK